MSLRCERGAENPPFSLISNNLFSSCFLPLYHGLPPLLKVFKVFLSLPKVPEGRLLSLTITSVALHLFDHYLIASLLNCSCYLSFSSIALTLLFSFQYSSLSFFYIVLMLFFAFLHFPLLNGKYAPKFFLIFSLSFFFKISLPVFILPSSLNIPLFFHFAE